MRSESEWESILLLLPSAIPEMQVGIHPLRHSRNFLSGIHVFAFSFGFQILWTVDPGLKIAGVTKKGQ